MYPSSPVSLNYCRACAKPLKGRTDKKFCNDVCRNNHHNRTNAREINLRRNINNTLNRNRRILHDILQQTNNQIVTQEHLATRGFSFLFYTHIQTLKNGHNVVWCYDHGYYTLPGNKLAIVPNPNAEIQLSTD